MRSSKKDKKDVSKLKQRDKEAILKFITSMVLMIMFLGWGLGYISIAIPVILGVSLLPPDSGKSFKSKWNSMSKKQKGIFVLVIAMLMPFIVVGLIWVAMLGSMLFIDLLVFFPIFLIISWFVFRKSKSDNMFIRFLGSPYALAVGVVLLGFVIGVAGYHYYEYEQSLHMSGEPVDKYMGSLISPVAIGGIKVNNDTYKVNWGKNVSSSGLGSVTNNNGKHIGNVTMNVSKPVNLTIVVRDVLTPAWTGMLTSSGSGIQKYLSYEYTHKVNNVTNSEEYNKSLSKNTLIRQETLENLTIKQSGIPVSHAVVTLVGEGKDNKTFSFKVYTDSHGIAVFHDVKQGAYWLKVSAYGYRAYSLLFPVCNVTAGKPFAVLLVPNYYTMRIHWQVSMNTNMNGNILIKNYKQSIDSNDTYVRIFNPHPLSDADIIKTGFSIQKNLFTENTQRIQSMYFWLGVDDPNNPTNTIGEQMLFVQQMLYTQMMYVNPTNTQNMYMHEKQGIWDILSGIAYALATPVRIVLTAYSGQFVYINIHEVKITLKAKADGFSESGYHPQVYILTPSGNAGTQKMWSGGINESSIGEKLNTKGLAIKPYKLNTGEVTFYFTIPDHPETIGTPDSQYYFKYDKTYMEGAFNVIVWGRDIPSDASITVYSTMQIFYTIHSQNGVFSVGSSKNKVYSDGLNDTATINVASYITQDLGD